MYLEAIESDDLSFAAPVYVRGFIRTYGRYLGLDAEAAVAAFNASPVASSRVHEPVAVAPLPTRRRPTPWLWVAALAAAILVAFVGFKYVQLQKSDGGSQALAVASPAPSTAAGTTSAVTAPAPTSAPTSLPSRTLSVRVTADSWMSVAVDGAAVLEGLVKAGTVKNFHGKHVRVRVGNAGGVDLTVNGKELGKMGHAGDVVERTLVLAKE